jgi:hypothetical protein
VRAREDGKDGTINLGVLLLAESNDAWVPHSCQEFISASNTNKITYACRLVPFTLLK